MRVGLTPTRVAPARADALSSRQPQALLDARGAPPPRASLRRAQTRSPRDSRRRFLMRVGPHPTRVAPARADALSSRQPQALLDARGAPPHARRSGARRRALLATAAGAS